LGLRAWAPSYVEQKPLSAVPAAARRSHGGLFLLPMARLVMTGAEGPQGLAGYLAILLEPRYARP